MSTNEPSTTKPDARAPKPVGPELLYLSADQRGGIDAILDAYAVAQQQAQLAAAIKAQADARQKAWWQRVGAALSLPEGAVYDYVPQIGAIKRRETSSPPTPQEE